MLFVIIGLVIVLVLIMLWNRDVYGCSTSTYCRIPRQVIDEAIKAKRHSRSLAEKMIKHHMALKEQKMRCAKRTPCYSAPARQMPADVRIMLTKIHAIDPAWARPSQHGHGPKDAHSMSLGVNSNSLARSINGSKANSVMNAGAQSAPNDVDQAAETKKETFMTRLKGQDVIVTPEDLQKKLYTSF